MSSFTYFLLTLALAIAFTALGSTPAASAFAQSVRNIHKEHEKEGGTSADDTTWEASSGRILDAGKHPTDEPGFQSKDTDNFQPPVQSTTNHVTICIAFGAIVVGLVCNRWGRAFVGALTRGRWGRREAVMHDGIALHGREVPDVNEPDEVGMDEDAEFYDDNVGQPAENGYQPAEHDGEDNLEQLLENALGHGHLPPPVEPLEPAGGNPLNEEAVPLVPGGALALPDNNNPER